MYVLHTIANGMPPKQIRSHLPSIFPSLLPPQIMVKHTPPVGCIRQNAWRDKTRWKAPCSNKEKVPLVVWEFFFFFFGLARRKVMKHLRRRNITPNQGVWPTKKCADHKTCILWYSQPKYSCSTWLISITSPVCLPSYLITVSDKSVLCLHYLPLVKYVVMV